MEKVSKKYYYLDWIRVVATLLVLYGHLVGVASWSTEIYLVFPHETANLPIIPGTTHRMYILDTFFYNCGTQAGVIGVILFFMLSGYLGAMTRNKYTGKEFLIKRMLRILPGLWIALTICIIIGYKLGIVYSKWLILFNYIPLAHFIGSGVAIAVLWTLYVEILYAFIVAHINIITYKNIILTQLVILVLAYYKAKTSNISVIMYTLRYTSIVFFGSGLFLLHNEEKWKIYKFILSTTLGYFILLLTIAKDNIGESYYISLTSYAIAIGIWFLFYLLNKIGIAVIIQKNRIIQLLANTSYMVYLLQLNIGLTVMYAVKNYIHMPFIILFIGVFSTYVVATITHYCIENRVGSLFRKVLNYETHE